VFLPVYRALQGELRVFPPVYRALNGDLHVFPPVYRALHGDLHVFPPAYRAYGNEERFEEQKRHGEMCNIFRDRYTFLTSLVVYKTITKMNYYLTSQFQKPGANNKSNA
jgi:hypothetical protein